MAPPVAAPPWFKKADYTACPKGGGRGGRDFIDEFIRRSASFIKETASSEGFASKKGFMQALEPGARIYGALMLIVSSALAGRMAFLVSLFFLTGLLACLSGVGFKAILKRMLPSIVFTLVIIAPVSLNMVTPGKSIFGFEAGGLEIAVTDAGARAVLFFLARVISMAGLMVLLLLTAGQAGLFAGLGRLPVPAFFVTALFMSYRYLLVLLKTAEEAAFARRSRTIGGCGAAESQGWFASRVVFLLNKSIAVAEEVNMALSSRGFSGVSGKAGRPVMKGRDYLWVGLSLFFLFLSLGI